MFGWLGTAITRFWYVFLAGWIALLVGSGFFAPNWDAITKDSDVSFLPENSPSRRGDALFQEAFPEQYAATNIVLVVERSQGQLHDDDQTFIEDVLKPRLMKIADRKGASAAHITRVRTMGETGTGALLVSPDNQATIVVVELSTPFLDPQSIPLVKEIEQVIDQARQAKEFPKGLQISLTGSATAGRDYIGAQIQSVHAIEIWTIIAVVVLLLLLYRAPLVALIPLATVYVAVQLALNLLAIAGEADIILLSGDVRIFITVLAYGAGVDYCLFLIARYREEIQEGLEPVSALAHAISRVGGPISASAATVICGIGVLAFMQFGKIREAGMVIPFALFIVLCGTLTFSAGLLRLTGRWAFWPHEERHPQRQTTIAPSLVHRFVGWDIWESLGPILLRRPWLILLVSLAAMTPFAVIAARHYEDQNYNPITDLPANAPSVAGSQALEKHFPPGILGSLTVFVKNEKVNFNQINGKKAVAALAEQLRKHRKELGIADIRSLATPFGITEAAEAALDQASSPLGRQTLRVRAAHYYVSRVDPWKGNLTRLDILLDLDPYSSKAVGDLEKIEAAIKKYVPRELASSEITVAGSTVIIRDLAAVKQSDQQRVEIIVPLVIFVLLWFVLHRVVISFYLVASVLISYLTTLGVAFILFQALYPGEFVGLDWKVPIFLFTILVAVGEDYNIFLITRIKEEQAGHGPLRGITHALARTGRVISGCGFIMAGTFASLLSGSLLAIKELGFALSFGILLDTLVVRPILVPTFLILLESRLGWIGRYMALSRPQQVTSEPVAALQPRHDKASEKTSI